MPSDNDFDAFESDNVDSPSEAEIAAARRILAHAESVGSLPDVTAPEVYDDSDFVDAVEKAKPKKGNRKQRRATKIPDSAPKPQDHQKASAARVDEAQGSEIVLTLWDEEIRIDRAAAVNSWDWQLGAIGKNPLQMVKGMLGEQQFFWFCARAESKRMSPMDAAAEIMSMFAAESGVGTAGNS